MTRSQLLMFLAGAITASWLTMAEATAIRERYDDGDTEGLPLPPQEAIPLPTVEQAAAALAVIAVLLGLRRERMTLILSTPQSTRAELRERLQDAFEVRARVMALLPVPEWHAAMRDGVRDHLLGQYALGLGRPLTAADLTAVRTDVLTQLGYLSRFADERAAKALAGRPMSDAQVASRNALYSGQGRAAWFAAAGTRLGPGWLEAYESRDDKGTCSPCLGAEHGSPYLPGSGPMPGSICLGHGRCRCIRVPQYDPAAYRRLTGNTVIGS